MKNRTNKPAAEKSALVKSVLGIGVAGVLFGAVTTSARADDTGSGELTPEQIFQKMTATYASLFSYSDSGQVVTTLDGGTKTTVFSTRLERPGFYLLEWQPIHRSAYPAQASTEQAVWSSGAGDYLNTGFGPQDQGSPEIGLNNAKSFSDGATATVPTTFFNLTLGSTPGISVFEEHRQPDGLVGKTECYVFKSELDGKATTLWIGKEDFLIHQVQTTFSASTMESSLAQVTEESPEMNGLLHEFTATETHNNIVVNKAFKKEDFIPDIPETEPLDDDY